MEACSYVIIERFEEICNRQDDKQLSDLMELDLENFIDILKSDGLNLVNEDILIEIVRSYISIREKVVPKLADTAEARTPPALWALLTSDEKNNRVANFDAEKKTKDVALTEAMDQEAAVYFSKDLPDRVQHVLDIKQKERNLILKENSDKVKLSDEEKERIYRCIRYAFLPQEALLKLSTDKDFGLAKEFIVQGLACKLGGSHQFASEELKITIKPRIAMGCAQLEVEGYTSGEEVAGARKSMGTMSQMGQLLTNQALPAQVNAVGDLMSEPMLADQPQF